MGNAQEKRSNSISKAGEMYRNGIRTTKESIGKTQQKHKKDIGKA